MLQEDLYFHGVKALITNNDRKILLLQVNTISLRNRSGDPYWDMPWGRVCRGMSIEDTLQREVNEEMWAHDITIEHYIGTALSPIRIPYGDTDYGLFLSVYDCSISDWDVVLSDEHQAFERFDIEDALHLLSVKYPSSFLDLLRWYFQK